MVTLLYSGESRSVWLFGSPSAWRNWIEKLQRPPSRLVLSKLEVLADLPLEQLVLRQRIWKYEAGTEPKIYAIKVDQARLYCCLRGQDIVILDWDSKKASKANPLILHRAEQRARKVIR